MTPTEISGISPFFIVSDAPSALAFYRDRLGFEITFQQASSDDLRRWGQRFFSRHRHPADLRDGV